ncbi:MAG: NAD-dependent epimerase/dehydratase family protein [Hyphomonadaceae bacterium]|nr:NAD-dependent epimerase/dehydratase family protein [Hyphomonadaceae bacterium]
MKAGDAFAAMRGRRVAILGGLGFIGSTLALGLAESGAGVLIIDNEAAGSGANPANLRGCERKLELVRGDIRDTAMLSRRLSGCEVIFNLAAESSHLGSMDRPLLDLNVNAGGSLAVLEACRKVAPDAVIVFASTRQVYGRPSYLPVDENHPVRPVDVNGVSKHAAEQFHQLFYSVYGQRTIVLRLTNVFGPRMRIADARQTFLGEWLRRSFLDERFEVWGGRQLRDLTFVEDVAEALALAAQTEKAQGSVLNVGGCEPISLIAIAEHLVQLGKRGGYSVKPFPANRARIDIGDYYSDDATFRRLTGWAPRTSLPEGLQRTLDYFQRHFVDYTGVSAA